jgi:hypothetical protein
VFEGNYCYSAIELEAVERAGQLFSLLAPYHDQVPYQGLVAQEPVAACLGGLASVLGRYDVAERYLKEGTELNVCGGMKYAEARTQLLWGRMLAVRARHGDDERAKGCWNGPVRRPRPMATA